jgi:hypothetical protein
MRKSILSLIVLATFAVFVGVAAAATVTVKITEQQVKNVCGGKLVVGHGHFGCSRKCGEFSCDYDCNTRTGECSGWCLTCHLGRFVNEKKVVKKVIRHARWH